MKKKLCALALCLVLLTTSLLAGCDYPRDASTSGTLPGWRRNGGEEVTLDWYINFSWYTTPWGGNLVSDTITRETNTSVNFLMPTGNEWEKLDSMIVSGDLPDLITLGNWELQISQMITEDRVWALNELADEYDPYFWQVAQPQRVAWFTQEDGNLYGYPNSSFTPSDYETHDNLGSNQAFLVRKDIYEAIGSPDMTTPEGFVGAIRRAAEMFPEGEAGPLIPIGLYDFDRDGCFSLEGILMNLLAVPFEKDGEKYDRHTDPDYVAWLKVFRGLAAEGYLPSEVFVDRRAQMAEKVGEGRYFCMLYQYTDIADQQKRLYDEDPNSAYIAVDGPRNAAGDAHTLPGVGINGWTLTFISKSCENPERAIRLMSYMMSEEGQKLLYCGVEGETYDTVDGKPVVREDVLDLLNSDRAAYNRLYGADNTYWMLQDLPMQLDWKPPLEGALAQPEAWTYPYTVYTAAYETNFPAGTEAETANQKIREAWGAVLPKLLLAESDEAFDALFAEFLQTREALGFGLVQQAATEQMRGAKERLSME